jgi:eukaryotic-like serine/threonine-protein kinase
VSADARERWRQVDGIVEAALELDPSERPAFLGHACGEDTALRRDVESILTHDHDDGFLESPAAGEAARLTFGATRASLVGERIGPFEVLERIGSGGMGEVYEARDSRLQRRVAIKRLPAHLSADPERVRRFRQEALAASALNHPNIVTVHEIVEHEGGDLLVTELVDGITLRERARDGPLPLATVLDIGLQIANGLAAAHAIGIVHRDVKPPNVMIRRDGLVKVLDFGIAKSAERAVGEEKAGLRSGTVIGTAAYMSPEQVRGGPVDARTDVFSLGVILHELATGESPFAAATSADSLAAVLERDPAPPSRRCPVLPEDFDRLVARALSKDPAGRFADAAELAAALSSLASAGTASTRRVPRRSLLALLALGLALAATLGARHFAARDAIDSLAVLPFENKAGDPDAEYLSDGLTESLIDQMSRLPSLRVMARATVFGFKGTSDPLAAGRRLGVGAILTGTVSRRGDQLLATAELVQTSTGARLWGESYDRPLSDLILVQDSIAVDIAGRLRPRLSQDERLVVRQRGTDSVEAHELFLKARFWLAKETEEGDLEARQLFQRAAEADPAFVEPHIGIAVTHARAAVEGVARPGDSWHAVEAAAVQALRLDPGNALARAQRVNRSFFFEWDFARVEREYRQMDTDPLLRGGGSFSPVLPMALFFWARGSTAEAVALIERALEDDPGNAEIRRMRADLLGRTGRLEAAIGQYQAVAAAEPDDPSPWFGLAEVLKRRGDVPGAIDALRKAYALSGEAGGAEALNAASTEEDYEDAEVVVARGRLSDLEAIAQERYVSPLNLARLHAQIGDRQNAFAALEAAFAERSPGLVFLKVDRAWDRIRDDPRFAALVRRVGIP